MVHGRRRSKSFEKAKFSLMLGVNATTGSVSRFKESCLAPNIGLEAIWSLHDSGLSRTHTC